MPFRLRLLLGLRPVGAPVDAMIRRAHGPFGRRSRLLRLGRRGALGPAGCLPVGPAVGAMRVGWRRGRRRGSRGPPLALSAVLGPGHRPRL